MSEPTSLSLDAFRAFASEALGVDLGDDSPHGALLDPDRPNLFIPAGAGAGKTTGLALLALEALFVHGFRADAVLATTFTRKAAAELRSRITKGVMAMADLTDRRIDEPALDVAAMRIGTIDDLTNQALIELQLGALVDGTVQSGLMRQAVFDVTHGFRREGKTRATVQAYLKPLFGSRESVVGFRDSAVTLHDRLGQDQIDVAAWSGSSDGANRTHAIIDRYRGLLAERGQSDFVTLEEEFFSQLESGGLDGWLEPLRVLLVDEYQDTNLLQESIYRHIAEHALSEGGRFAIVGDDEQSLYRFRGATVELFIDAPSRFPTDLKTVNLNINRRSSKPIVEFANKLVELDPDYQPVRAAGKASLEFAPDRSWWEGSDELPVLGLFRPDVSTLAEDIAGAIAALLGTGWEVPGGKISVTQPGDIAVLGPTTGEVTEGYGKINRRIFAGLADECESAGIPLFNPRGKRLAEVPSIQQLLGLALECLDPREEFLPDVVLRQARGHMGRWRDSARELIVADPEPREPHGLSDFVDAWKARTPQGRGVWPREFPLMELLHELTVWIPDLRQSPGFLYLEGVTRSLDQLGTLFGPWAVLVSRDRWDKSVKKFYEEFFIPIAFDEVELDEEVLEVLPLDAVNAITIHQAKGLEFPVCFVDVGSRFTGKHWTQAFARFPLGKHLRAPYTVEDELRRFSSLGAPARPAVDRAFDDLTRMFYVADTRAQHLLVLFGIGDAAKGPKDIPNVATGWTRKEENRWMDLGVQCI
jgi:DNA helicase-2/ATP-dependent DNA helicase PcrA